MAKKFSEKTNQSTETLTIGKIIRSYRKANKIRQADLAMQLKISQSYMWDLESDRSPLTPQKASELAQALGQSEKLFIQLAIQDQLNRKGFQYKVDLQEN